MLIKIVKKNGDLKYLGNKSDKKCIRYQLKTVKHCGEKFKNTNGKLYLIRGSRLLKCQFLP